MMDHSSLVAEIQHVEKMSTAERLKHARKRRNQQLKAFLNYDKNLEKEAKKRKTASGKGNTGKKIRVNKIQFVSNIMLLEAAARNDIEEVRYLLMEGVSPDVTNEDGLTALHQCCIDDLESMMKLLIEFGANVNARDSELWTPLHAAATCGHVQLCKILVENGAELLSVNADGNMPYDICEDEHTLDYVESEMAKRGVTQELIDETRLSTEKKFLSDMQYLSENGEDLEFRGRNGETPLHIASANGYIQVAEFLLDQHVAVDSLDDDHWQPIHCAACWGQLAVLEVLVLSGALLDAKTRNGETPLDICEDPDIKQRLLEMKDEMESHRATQRKDLRRRRSQNTRSSGISNNSVTSIYSSTASLSGDKHISTSHSASVRRTSMREKSAISWKEAREEAQRLRESAGSADDDDDDNTLQPPPEFQGAAVPATNIDDVKLNLDMDQSKVRTETSELSEQDSENKKLRHHTLPPAALVQPAESPSPIKEGLDKPFETTTHVPAIVVSDKENVSPDNNMNKLPNESSETSYIISGNGNNTHESSAMQASQPMIRTQSLSGPSTNIPSSTRPVSEPPMRKGSVHSDSRKSSVSSQGLPVGTLADLKKQRAQKLQEAMKNHSQAWGDQSSTGTSNGHTSSENVQTKANGINTNKMKDHEPPVHKYTASQMEIVGQTENNASCCVIL